LPPQRARCRESHAASLSRPDALNPSVGNYRRRSKRLMSVCQSPGGQSRYFGRVPAASGLRPTPDMPLHRRSALTFCSTVPQSRILNANRRTIATNFIPTVMGLTDLSGPMFYGWGCANSRGKLWIINKTLN
jgi:hypothetical protein